MSFMHPLLMCVLLGPHLVVGLSLVVLVLCTAALPIALNANLFALVGCQAVNGVAIFNTLLHA